MPNHSNFIPRKQETEIEKFKKYIKINNLNNNKTVFRNANMKFREILLRKHL